MIIYPLIQTSLEVYPPINPCLQVFVLGRMGRSDEAVDLILQQGDVELAIGFVEEQVGGLAKFPDFHLLLLF